MEERIGCIVSRGLDRQWKKERAGYKGKDRAELNDVGQGEGGGARRGGRGKERGGALSAYVLELTNVPTEHYSRRTRADGMDLKSSLV